MLTTLLAILVAAATFMQAYDSLLALRAEEEKARTFNAVDDLMQSVPLRRPVKWVKHRWFMRQLLKANPSEAAGYWMVWRTLMSWSILLSVSVLVVADGVI